MATRMATLLYGEKPNTDVEAGNRADTADTVAQPAAPYPPSPSFVSPSSRAGVASTVPDLPPMRPMYPTPSPWGQPFALRGIVLGLVAAAVVFAGLSIFGIALAWSQAMTTFAHVGLMVLGGYLIGVGLAYIVSVDQRRKLAASASPAFAV